MNEEILEIIREISLNNFPHEGCGVLLKNKENYKAIECVNRSEFDKRYTFVIDSCDYIKYLNNYDLIGFFHSQQDKRPSELDLKIHKQTGLKSVIYSFKEDDFIILN